MNVAEVLKLADDLLFTHAGKHLDALQETILKETLKGHKYAKIATAVNLSEGHVRDTAAELWQFLSDALGEKINKLNVRSVLETVIIANNRFARSGNFIGNHQVNICSSKRRSPKSSHASESTENKHELYLDNAPEFAIFYGRTNEISTLKTWIIKENIRLINLVGIIGTGKTSLAIKLIEEIADKFEYIIYRSLSFSPSINTFVTELLQTLSSSSIIPNTLDQQVRQLLNFLRKHRCLVLIDDVQMLFKLGEFAGQYQREFAQYHFLFKQVAELSHKSCFFLISSEHPADLIPNNQKLVRSLEIAGLKESAQQILTDKNLLDEQDWDALITKYQGHPLWLELIATMIQELFSGRVSEFLAYSDFILTPEIIYQFNQIWLRLTDSEKKVINYLAKQENAMSLNQVLQEISIHNTPDILNTIQSLKKRCLLKNTNNEVGLFKINSILKAYILRQI